jgi:hypothetical protein
MLRMYRVSMTITPILLGVFILAVADETSDIVMGTIVIAGGLLAGALFWWDIRRSRRE